MNEMKKTERIKAALNCEETDRIPVSVWMHYSGVDQDPLTLAKAQVWTAEQYEYDFIKLMPFGLYGVQDWGTKIRITSVKGDPPEVLRYAIRSAKDWERLEVLPGLYGSYGNQVLLAQYVSRFTKGEIPFVQTVFSPLTTARKMAGDRILIDMKENPQLLKQALQVITDTTINFVRENINAGVNGFFFATQCCNSTYMREEEYREFGLAFDRQVVDSYKDITYFNIGHLHGENGMFTLFDELGHNAVNWHDRWCSPSMKEARSLSDKCFVGGIRECAVYDQEKKEEIPSPLEAGSEEEIYQHIREAAEGAGRKGLILSPGCCASQFVGERQLEALKRAVARLGGCQTGGV